MIGFSNWINEFWKWDLKDIAYSEIVNTFILAGFPFDSKLFNPVISTLRTEMIVSAVLPFFIFVALRVNRWVNFIILCILFSIGKDILGIFYLGIIMAIYRIEMLNLLQLLNRKKILFLFIILASIFYTSRFSLNFVFPIYNKFTFLLSILGCLCFLILALKNEIFAFFLNTKFLQFLGKISYSLYLFHFPILLVVCSFSLNKFLVFPISLFLTFVLSYLVYVYVELPFMKWGKIVINKI